MCSLTWDVAYGRQKATYFEGFLRSKGPNTQDLLRGLLDKLGAPTYIKARLIQGY